ncbi:MAG: peptide chain release factor N(5)-glutamine methyltransferase [Peptococcaceae bacterium]|jgi:release factor glutamine methyltransferase|nr:peptide chain release factor N(5)-glutamine methyltransferase [Peptococcaceae bacterium]
MKIKEIWQQQASTLAAALIEENQEAKAAEAEEICRLLLAFVLHCEPKELRLRQEEELTAAAETEFLVLCGRAAAGYPVQYLTGEQEFMGLSFFVGEGVLIPRWETELLVEKALTLLPKKSPVTIADICTGSGAIGVSLCHYLPLCHCFAVDISEAALAYAGKNSRRSQVGERMTFLQGDLLAPLQVLQQQNSGFALDMILSNPPYVTAAEMANLPENVRYEPSLALYGGEDGLYFYRRLASEGPALLKDEGWLCVECGYTQGEAIKKLWQLGGLQSVEICRDYAGKDRMVIGQKIGSNRQGIK